jgi:RND family efflux transporter MFP subunit
MFGKIQTLMYLKLSVAGHLTIFLTRTRGPFWSIRPARILWVAVLGTQVLATLIAVYGVFMTPLGWDWALFVWGYALAWFLANDRVKLLAYRIFDPVKKSSVRTRAGRSWIGSRHPLAVAVSPEGGQIQLAGTVDQTAAGSVSTHWRIPAAAALVVLALGGGWLYWSTHRTAAVQYVTQKIKLGSIVRTVTASGGVVPTATAPISARVSGVIQALYCAANTKVKAGQLCAKIDPHPYQGVLNQANADLAAAEDRLEKDKTVLVHTKAAFERASWRSKRRAIFRKALDNSRRTYEQAQTQMNLGESTVAELQAALHAAETNLGDTDIVSPIDGTVISRDAAIGETVPAGSETAPLFLVAADRSVIRVDANVSKNDIDEIKLGDKASFSIESIPNRPFTGEITQIGAHAAPNDVVISAPNPELLLKPGMTATIKIVVDRRDDVLRVPDQALRYSPAGSATPSGSSGARAPLDGWPQVWILREGRPTAVPVQLGLQDGAFTEIVKGNLTPRDDLIIRESGGRVNQ